MTLRLGHRKRPPFPFSERARADQLVCDPRSYVRAWQDDGRPLWAPCLSWAPGPSELGVTGDGSFTTLYGSDWLLQICADGTWVLYQRTANETLTVTAWDVTPPVASISARHPSLAFDQAAKPAIAWEDASGIWLREFNEIASEYAFIGPFAGHDPVLLCDATVNYHVGGSDVVLFYLSDDRTKLNYRVQNENFAVEHEHHDFGTPVVLDAPDIGGWKFQLRYSNEQGAVIPSGSSFQAVLSDAYPIYTDEAMQGAIQAPAFGEYQLVIISHAAQDTMSSTISALADGLLLSVIINRAGDDSMTASIAALNDGVLQYVIIPRTEGPDEMSGGIGPLTDGLLFFVIIQRGEVVDSMTASIGSLGSGAYAAA